LYIVVQLNYRRLIIINMVDEVSGHTHLTRFMSMGKRGKGHAAMSSKNGCLKATSMAGFNCIFFQLIMLNMPLPA
jgi:hypothetical protein